MTDLNPEGLERAAEAVLADSNSLATSAARRFARAAVTAYLGHAEVTTVEELDALPVGVTIISADGWPWLYDSDGEGTWWWESPGHEEGFTSDEIPLPARVVHRGTS